MLLLHELIDEGNGGSSSESFMRHAVNFSLGTPVLNVVRVLDEVEAKLEQALVLCISRRELDMATLGWEHLVAGRELRFHKVSLTMASARSEDDLDTTFLDRAPVNSFIVFLLQLEQATAKK